MAVLCVLLQVFYWVLLARVILSWVRRLPDGLRPIAEVVYSLTDPVMRLVRPLIPPVRIGMAQLDLSILLVFLALYLLTNAICFR